MEMSDEEVYYWFGKINNGKCSLVLKVMRVLLGDL